MPGSRAGVVDVLARLGWVVGVWMNKARGGGKCRVATVLIFLSSSRTKPLWRPWLPQEEYMTRRQREQMDTVSFILPARVHFFFFPLAVLGSPASGPRLLYPL